MSLEALSRGERLALRVARLVNESGRVKLAAQWCNEQITSRWMMRVSAPRMHLVGVERLRALRPDRGVLLASNHRSFFDMFMIATHLHAQTDLIGRLFFPVRSEFFYDGPVGMLVNFAMSAMAMYPPVFRAPEKRDVTRLGLDFLARELRRPGTVVGMHPEGTRGKGPDPYELLPPEPGFGRVVLESHPVVLPIFVNGLGNDFVAEVRGTTGVPIILVFGEPVDLGSFADADPHRLRAQIAVGAKVLAEIAQLAELERTTRAALVHDRRWR